MTQHDATLQGVLTLPLHKACELTLVSLGEQSSDIAFAVNDFTANPTGALHGGILYTMMDVACFFAVYPHLPQGQHPVTIENANSVLRAAFLGEQVRIRAKADRIGRTIAAMRAEAYAINANGEERLIATGSVTKSIITLAAHASS